MAFVVARTRSLNSGVWPWQYVQRDTEPNKFSLTKRRFRRALIRLFFSRSGAAPGRSAQFLSSEPYRAMTGGDHRSGSRST
jgi:hypothetical protein